MCVCCVHYIFYLVLPGDLGSAYGSLGSYSMDPYSMASMDGMSVFSAASSVVNPQSMRGIVHRWVEREGAVFGGGGGGGTVLLIFLCSVGWVKIMLSP